MHRNAAAIIGTVIGDGTAGHADLALILADAAAPCRTVSGDLRTFIYRQNGIIDINTAAQSVIRIRCIQLCRDPVLQKLYIPKLHAAAIEEKTAASDGCRIFLNLSAV